MGTRARVTTVAGAATLLCAASTFGGGLAALAAPSTVSTPAPVLATAPTPMLVGSCGDTVRGDPGQPVGVRVAKLPVINVGSVPASGSETFDATPTLRKAMGPTAPVCMITAEPFSPATAPIESLIAPAVAPVTGAVGEMPALGKPSSPGAPAAPSPAAPADQSQPGVAPAPAAAAPPNFGPAFGPMMPSNFPFALGAYNSGFPRYDYAQLLAIGRPGALGRMSTGMLTADLFGAQQQISNGSGGLGKQSAAANDVAAAGRASALPASGVERIALPVLVAVLMLASVTAALLRSWVLGRR